MSFITDIFRAISKPQFYRTVKERGYSRAFLHMLILTILYAILVTHFASKYVLSEMNEFAGWARDNFPSITIEAGRVSTDANEPYFTSFEPYELNFVFSTRRDYQDIDNLSPNTVVVESDQVLFFDGQDTYEPFSMDELVENTPDGAIIQATPETIERFRQGLNRLFRPLTFVCMFAAALLGYFVMLFILSLYALIADKVLKTNLSYKQILSIVSYGLTPFYLLLYFQQFFVDLELPNPIGIGFVLALVYIALGIRANQVEVTNEPNNQNG